MLLGTLYLIPTTLGNNEPSEVLPISVQQTVQLLDYFIVEKEKTARSFIKKIAPEKQLSQLKLLPLNKHTDSLEVQNYLEVCKRGISVGLLSEAGVPAVADPGRIIVAMAHQKNIAVVPLVGPCSIIMALMASGLNGQNFAFNGYLPVEKFAQKQRIKFLENLSQKYKQSQIFMETPYRTQKLFGTLLQTLQPRTHLCVAADITLKTQYIKTYSVNQWQGKKINLQKRPTIFVVLSFIIPKIKTAKF